MWVVAGALDFRRLNQVDLNRGMDRPGRRAGRRELTGGALLSFMVLALTACTLPSADDQKAPEVAPRLEEPVALEVGETETFTFKADGVWYPAPYMIHRGQRMNVAFSNGKAPVPAGAVRYRIGQMEQILVPDPTDFLVTRPGPMSFYFDPSRGNGYHGEIEVTITRES